MPRRKYDLLIIFGLTGCFVITMLLRYIKVRDVHYLQVEPNIQSVPTSLNITFPTTDWEKRPLGDSLVKDWRTLSVSTTSEMYIKNPQNVYQVGDTVKIHIVAKDSFGRPKQIGGDEIRIWVKDLQKEASSAGQVTDNQNGTYEGTVKLLWPGNVSIKAGVFTPREYVTFLLRGVQTWKIFRHSFARFVLGSEHETTTCTANQDLIQHNENYCNLTQYNSDLPWFCEKPKRLPCSSWTSHAILENVSNMQLSQETISMLKQVLIRPYIKPSLNLTVLQLKPDGMLSPLEKSSLVSCNKISSNLTWTAVTPTGYLYEGKWRPSFCRATYNGSVPSFKSCLQGRRFWLFGDSTTRQFFSYFKEEANLKMMTRDWLKPVWYEFSLMTNAEKTFNISWGIHSLPFYSGKEFYPHAIATGSHTYIDSIPAGSTDVVLIHFYLHFQLSPIHVMRRSVQKAVESIKKLKKRAPEVKVLVKGPHAFHEKRWWFAEYSDFWGNIYQRVLQEEFASVQNDVIFLNFWDITVAIENQNDHPERPQLKVLIDYMMSLICPLS